MNKYLRLFLSALFLFSVLSSISFVLPTPVHAIDPAEPPANYFFDKFFPLFRFIKPSNLIVFENADRNRKYPPIHVCNDQRAHTCYADTDCVGQVDLCYDAGGDVFQSDVMGNRTGQCQKPSISPVYDANGKLISGNNDNLQGTCKYVGNAKSTDTVMSTDFSNPNTSSITTPSSPTDSNAPASQSDSSLVYPKLQNEAYRYDYNSGSDNVITNGSLNLSLSLCDRLARQVMVVKEAKFTKNTVESTGEWPLGWVNWNFVTPNGRTLSEIADELPGNVGGDAFAMAYAHEQFLVTLGNEAIDTSAAQKDVCDTYLKDPSAKWAVDLAQSPMYPPSNVRSYARKSVCRWFLCCPGLRCPLQNITKSEALYTDPTVHQAWAAAVDNLFITYPLDQAIEIFRKVIIKNPLARYALSTLPTGTPSEITGKLDAELKDEVVHCGPPDKPIEYKYVTGGYNPLTLGKLGFIYDYQELMDASCYKLQPESITKEKGGSYTNTNIIQDILSAIFPEKVDMVDRVTHHYITIPDVMGQSLADLQDAVYNTRDTLADVVQQEEYNKTISNTVNDQGGIYPFSGKPMSIADSKRRLAYFACSDPDYSAPQTTSIEQYATGLRNGCFQQSAPSGTCDGQLFAKLLENAGGVTTTPSLAADNAFNLNIKPVLTPELMNAYAAAEKATGVPCEVIAGLHFEEASSAFVPGGNPASYSVQNGGAASRDGGFAASAVAAGKTLLRHPFDSLPKLITAISDYNGGGNSNCQLGYPYPIPYNGCPRAFIGDDDPYATNLLDARHTNMWLLYHGDLTASAPTAYGNDRPGAFTVALEIYNNLTKNGSPLASPTPIPTASPTSTGSTVAKGNFPKTCGQGIQTALGCLPFTRDAFVSTLLTFIVGIAGAIALVVMLVGTFQIMTAAGDAKKMQKGRELFTAALAGLLFLIFSVSLLRIIAGNVIKLPGF